MGAGCGDILLFFPGWPSSRKSELLAEALGARLRSE